MPEIIEFPPLKMVGWEPSLENTLSISQGSSGAKRGSQTRAPRSTFTFIALGSEDGAGYVAVLRQLLSRQLPLVRVTVAPSYWWHNWREEPLGAVALDWLSADTPLIWASGGDALTWTVANKITAVAGPVGQRYLDCAGLPPGEVIRVGERVSQGDEEALVCIEARVAADGTARLYLSSDLQDGDVLIGQEARRDFCLDDGVPGGVQSRGRLTYTFTGTEVFADDYAELTYRNPWRA